ncbi:cupin domain-containing protein [Cyclobacterium sp.]|uniref:cupin domain-containing protein n=1 Tax=Cyclobacterium sp. TaxID=1966343 RepID=UPI0019A3B0EE|nr:cupin domain-containing protein [Cyclobacterium sp.]MBD3627990.1 cupin domain-containing protein [Cyclobacterium sp.]
MDRKTFIKKTGVGAGLALIPNLSRGGSDATEIKQPAGMDPKIIRDDAGTVLNVIGDVQTHKLVGSDTDNQIVEWVDDVAPGVGIPPHIHSKEDEIFRVIKGQIELMIDGKKSLLKAGDIAFAPKNMAHSWTVTGTEKAKMITSAFPAGIEKMFEELADLPPGPPDFSLVERICGDHGVTFV